MVNEQLRECADHTIKNLKENDQIKKQEQIKKFSSEILPKTLSGYEKMLGLNSSQFIVGNCLSWADLALVNAWEWLDDVSKQQLNYYPLVKKHNDYIRTVPLVADWLKQQKPLRVFKYC